MIGRLPTLGAGLGFRPPFLADLFLHRQAVDFLEITADHYLNASDEKLRELELLYAHFPIIPHALDLSLGSAGGIDRRYLAGLAGLVSRLDPPWWSEHIAFTRAGGVEIGHLAPLPFTRESAAVVARNVEVARAEIPVPLILENISSPLMLPGEMEEADFLTEVLDRTGCGLLCDVTNLYTNVVNHGGDLDRTLDRWPWDRVVQLHVAGGHRDGELLIDSHAHPVAAEVWRLLEEVMARSPVRGVIIERDEHLPPFGELAAEVERARRSGKRAGRWA